MADPPAPARGGGDPDVDLELPPEGGVLGEPHAPPPEPPRPTRRESLVARHGRSLRQHAARGTLINTGFLVGLSGLGLVRGFLLAGFLTAADYGVWGILVVSLGTILWLKQVGIGDKYIQQDDPDQEVAFQKAFTLELAFTAIFMLLLVVLLPVIVLVYGESELLAPGLVIVLLLPAGALQAPLWIYYRNMEFVRQRVLQSIDPVVGFVVAIGLAAAGAGYWAFAGGALAGAYSSAIAAIRFSPYKLRLRYDSGTLKSYASFSWPLFLSNGSSMVIAQSAVIATDARLGLAGAGAITLASQITSFTQRVDGLVTGTLYPAICAVRDRLDLLNESFVKSNRLALMWAVPFGFGLALFASDLVQFGIGEKWRPAVVLLEVYGVTAALGHVAYNWDAFMRATGQTKPIAIAAAASMVTFLAVGIPLLWAHGLPGLAAGVAAQVLANQICRMYFMRKLFNDFHHLAHASRSILPAVPGALLVLAMRAAESGPRTFAMAVVEFCLFVGVTILCTWRFEGGLLREMAGYLKPRAASPAAP